MKERYKPRHLSVVGGSDNVIDTYDPFSDPPGGPPKRWVYILRSYRRVAEQWHLCWHCCHDINPGDEYDAVVFVYAKTTYRKKRLVVEKRHTEPCEEPPDPNDDECAYDCKADHDMQVAA